MLSKDDALKIFKDKFGTDMRIYSVTEVPKQSWRIDPSRCWDNCWFINYIPSANEEMSISSRLMIISKETGEVIYLGSAYDLY